MAAPDNKRVKTIDPKLWRLSSASFFTHPNFAQFPLSPKRKIASLAKGFFHAVNMERTMPKRINIAQITIIDIFAKAIETTVELICSPPTPAWFFFRILLYRIPPSI